MNKNVLARIVHTLARYISLMVVALGLTLTLTGAAQNDLRPPTVDHPPSSPLRLFVSSPSSDGAELYQFWCSTCHGDRGQGLTEEFRATWPEGKQNCWQSKCHATNHPPEGFILPKNVPALVGPQTLTKFRTVEDLYVYSRTTMPYWSPNLLKDDEYRAITTFLVKANYAAQGVPLPTAISDDWTAVSLHPNGVVVEEPLADKNLEPSPTSGILPKPETPVEAQPPGTIVSLTGTPWLWAAIVIAGSGLIVWFTRRFSFPMNKKG